MRKLRRVVRRRNEVDVVATARLQFEHNCGESFVRDFIRALLFVRLRDLKVLAIDAAQIAVAEKDISRAVCAGQTRLFAEMRRVTRHNRQASRITRRDFVLQAIVAAILRTNDARFEQIFELFDSIL